MADEANPDEAERGTIRLPERSVQPLRQIGRRLLYALGILLVMVTSP